MVFRQKSVCVCVGGGVPRRMALKRDTLTCTVKLFVFP